MICFEDASDAILTSHKVFCTLSIMQNICLMRRQRPLFHLFCPFKHKLQILQQIGMWKNPIQYTVPVFELMTFGTRVSPRFNH